MATETLRLEIDGRWSAAEMGSSFQAATELYDLGLLLRLMAQDARAWEEFYDSLIHFPPFRKMRRYMVQTNAPGWVPYPNPGLLWLPLEPEAIRHLSRLAFPGEQLEARGVRYGSKGFKDLAGLGEVIGHLKDLLVKVIELATTKQQRQLDNDKRQLENDALRLKNAREYVKLAKECGYAETELRPLIRWVDDRQQVALDLAAQGKLLSARVLESTDSDVSTE